MYATEGEQTSRLASGFSALRHRDFRLFWIGQGVSLIGTWMQSVAQAWLVLKLTNSPFQLGLVTALQFVPVLFFSLFIGAICDRLSKRDIIIGAQAAMLILALILGLLTVFDIVQYWQVIVLAVLLGVANAFDLPARQAFIFELVGKEDISNAVALNSSMFNAARIVGPGIAGLVMARTGMALLFILNAMSFGAVLISLFMIAPRPPSVAVEKGSKLLPDVMDGLRYVKETPIIARALVLMAVISTFALNYTILVPVFAQDVIRGGAESYGFLMSSLGLGALVAAVMLAFTSQNGPSHKLLILGAISVGVFQILLYLTRSYYLSLILLFFNGLSMILYNASTNAIIQVEALDTYRGRVMSFYSLVIAGVTPIGALFAGTVSDRWGSPVAFALGGLITLLGVLANAAWERADQRKNSFETGVE